MTSKIVETNALINQLAGKLSELKENQNLELVADKYLDFTKAWAKYTASVVTAEGLGELLPTGAAKYEYILDVLCPVNSDGAIVLANGQLLQRGQYNHTMLMNLFGNRQGEFEQKKSALAATANQTVVTVEEQPAKENELLESEEPANNEEPTGTQNNAAQEINPTDPVQEETPKVERPELTGEAKIMLDDFLAKPTKTYISNYKANTADFLQVFKHLECTIPEHLTKAEDMNLAELKAAIFSKIQEVKNV